MAWESGYAAFRNNPIYYADPMGDFPKIGEFFKKVFKKVFGDGDGKEFKKVTNRTEFSKLDLATEGIQLDAFEVVEKAPPSIWDKISEIGSGVYTIAQQFENYTNSLKGSNKFTYGVSIEGGGGTNTDPTLVDRWHFNQVLDIEQETFDIMETLTLKMKSSGVNKKSKHEIIMYKTDQAHQLNKVQRKRSFLEEKLSPKNGKPQKFNNTLATQNKPVLYIVRTDTLSRDSAMGVIYIKVQDVYNDGSPGIKYNHNSTYSVEY